MKNQRTQNAQFQYLLFISPKKLAKSNNNVKKIFFRCIHNFTVLSRKL